MNYARFPVNFIGVSQQYKGSAHWGTDFGWNSNHGGPNVAVYAIADGECAGIVPNDPDIGNMIVTVHKGLINGKWVITRYHHLSKMDVKKGDVLKRGQQVGNMGSTGKQSTGPHLHFEFWICPQNYTYKAADKSKYAVDPMLYLYAYSGQTIGVNTKNAMKLPEQPETGVDYKALYDAEVNKNKSAVTALKDALKTLEG